MKYNPVAANAVKSRRSRAVNNGAGTRVTRPIQSGVSREQLLRHTEHDPQEAEEFVALLHQLRRGRASAVPGKH